jgi:hypothetical protein
MIIDMYNKINTMNKEFLKMQKLAGLITEGQFQQLTENEDALEYKIQQWVNNNAGGYGPDEDDDNYSKFKEEMSTLLSNTLEDFNPDNYGDSTSMSPGDILEDFIGEALEIIGKYTMEYYGDSTSFSPDDIKDEFYEFIEYQKD